MGSRVPELINALIAVGQADAGLNGVQVTDGPEVTDSGARDWLIVGFDGDPDGDFTSAQTVGGWSDLSIGREEQFQVTIAAIAQHGETDVRPVRERAYAIAARVEAWLRADPSLGLVSVEAAIEATQLMQAQTQQGAQATVLLTVAGRAFT